MTTDLLLYLVQRYFVKVNNDNDILSLISHDDEEVMDEFFLSNGIAVIEKFTFPDGCTQYELTTFS